jgi:hypothetical protein
MFAPTTATVGVKVALLGGVDLKNLVAFVGFDRRSCQSTAADSETRAADIGVLGYAERNGQLMEKG